VIENNQPNPVVVDLDGDGAKEILYASYDGRVHAFWLDKQEHGNWPYSVYNPGEGFYRFASEPVVVDLDRDGYAEVIFGSWVEKGTFRTGKLHILDYLGHALHEIDLPAAYGSPDWNGVLAAPTLDNVDDDPDLEVVLTTAHSGFVVYDLPGTANARILWGTGRQNYQRTASSLSGSLEGSDIRVSPARPVSGDTLRYAIRLENPGPLLESVRVTDTLPIEGSYLGDLWASSGAYDDEDDVITWWGSVDAGLPVTITFGVSLSAGIPTPYSIANTIWIDDGLGNLLQRSATAIVNSRILFLPLLCKR
jgi:uncharacterized repeat protein (TIGR01451 family)